ncbi:MAG: hypothetical protein M9887_10845 [Chitinophagales bacterium]|nr:hypothetical protein [Chitinophagales bacterium]
MQNSNANVLKPHTRILTFLAALAVFVVIFVPIWRIELVAPQYPEGLEMFIHADKLSGDVPIINGLNHYIGMRELHEKDFIEFAVLPYVIAVIAVMGVLVAIVNRRWALISWFVIYALFGVLAMIDFYQWLYNYGHNLDPTAPIKVPGMTYQPPMIGFKQLLNFGAYSIPDIGGWIMAGVGGLLGILVILELVKNRQR